MAKNVVCKRRLFCLCFYLCKFCSSTQKTLLVGCGDNLEYGYKFARNFIDVREKEESTKRSESQGRSLMNRVSAVEGASGDSVRISRFAVQQRSWPSGERGARARRRSAAANLGAQAAHRAKMQMPWRERLVQLEGARRLAGLSAMKRRLALQTCWMQLPTMREVGVLLHTKYRTARRIQVVNFILVNARICIFSRSTRAATCNSSRSRKNATRSRGKKRITRRRRSSSSTTRPTIATTIAIKEPSAQVDDCAGWQMAAIGGCSRLQSANALFIAAAHL